MPSDRDAKRRQKLVAQRLLIVIVFGGHHRENGSSTSSLLHVADARRLASTRIGDNDMPGTVVPSGVQHGLEPSSKGSLDERVRSEKGVAGWRIFVPLWRLRNFNIRFRVINCSDKILFKAPHEGKIIIEEI